MPFDNEPDRPDIEITPELAELAGRRERAQAEIIQIRARHDRELRGPRSLERELSGMVATEIARQIGVEAYDIELGRGHPCEPSPTSRCIYNTANDPAMDHCLFCHEPDERK